MMRSGNSLRDLGLLTLALIGFAIPVSSARAQAANPNETLVSQLAALETAPDMDVAALRQQAVDRIKSRADATALRRPPLVAQLRKLPQFSVDVVFDPDSSIVRPPSYGTIGRIADVLSHPTLLPYGFLIVGHTESTGRRDLNLALSQRRADSIRDVLVNTFKISPKRIKAIGLGEEQLLDAIHPTAAVNQQMQVVSLGPAS